MKTIKIFCAGCQIDTQHSGEVDFNGEMVFTCVDCGQFMKVPAGVNPTEVKSLIKNQKSVNEGQISIKDSIETLDSVMEDGEEIEEPTE